jgi:hypothetical protein
MDSRWFDRANEAHPVLPGALLRMNSSREAWLKMQPMK